MDERLRFSKLDLKRFKAHDVKQKYKKNQPNKFKFKFTDEELIEIHKKGLYDKEIALVLGCSQSTVGRRRRALGLESHRSRLAREWRNIA